MKKKVFQIPSKISRRRQSFLSIGIKRKTSSSGIFKEELKEIIEDKEILTDALEHLLDIKALLKAAVPRESDIFLEPVQIISKR